MARRFPAIRFERYCDDVIVHAAIERQARLLRSIAGRLAECGLALNEHKTRIVYCKDATRRGAARRGSHEHERFTFLGYTFRARLSRGKRGQFVKLPAGNRRPGAQTHRTNHPSLALAPLVAQHPHRPGQGDRRRSPGMDQLIRALLPLRVGPATQTDQRLPDPVGPHEVQAAAPLPRQSTQFLAAVYRREPDLFAHWRVGVRPDGPTHPGKHPTGWRCGPCQQSGCPVADPLAAHVSMACSSDSRGRAERAVRAARRD